MKNLNEERITEILEEEPHLFLTILEDELDSIEELDKRVKELNNLFYMLNLEKVTSNIDFIRKNLKNLDLNKYDVFQKENLELVKESLEEYEKTYKLFLDDIEILKKRISSDKKD